VTFSPNVLQNESNLVASAELNSRRLELHFTHHDLDGSCRFFGITRLPRRKMQMRFMRAADTRANKRYGQDNTRE
jgi:hypothetical protein